MEKFCPACSRVYGEDASHCEVDGERLVILNEEPSLVGHVLDGKYTLHAKLGEGGMGSVYLAEQATMGREVAIKVLRREFSQNRMAIKRFLREARAASKLTHPNTITVYDFGQSNDGLLYLVMERLTGCPLSDILDGHGAMPVERAVHILGQVCDSLSEAHSVGITHRDLKPENIFIEQKAGNPDFVKVLDFGIAKMQGEEPSQATATGMICGTPSYMSPEQAMGRDIDGRSDIYALGILLYEMLTDEKPFDGDTPMEVMLKHINEPPPNVYTCTGIGLPQGVQDALDKMLEKKCEDRPGNCQDVKRLLIEGLATPVAGPITVIDDPGIPQRRRDETSERAASLERTGLSPTVTPESFDEIIVPKRRRSPMWLLAAVVVVAAIVALWAATRSGEPARLSDVRPAGLDAPAQAETGTVEAPAPSEVALLGADGTAGAAVPAPPRPADPTPIDVTPGAFAGGEVASAAERALALEPAQRALSSMVTLTIRSQPDGAEVYENGTFRGTTPLDLVRERASGPVILTLKKPRYESREVSLQTDADLVHGVALARAATRPGAPRKDPKEEEKPRLGTF